MFISISHIRPFPKIVYIFLILNTRAAPGQPCTSLEQQEVFCTDAFCGNDNFGVSLSVHGQFLVVGANQHVFSDGVNLHGPGALFVYKRIDVGVPGDHSDDTWTFWQELVPWDRSNPWGTIGSPVAMSRNHIVTGRFHDDTGPGDGSGSAYVYRSNSGTWLPQQKLIPSDAAADLRFGLATAVSGDWIAVGSLLDASPSDPATGHVYLFRVDDQGTPDLVDDVWIEHVKIGHPMGHEFDRFGLQVAIHGNWLVVGAPATAAFGWEYNVGVAYVYYRDDSGTPTDLSDDVWIYQARLTASDVEIVDGFRRFSRSLGVDDQRVLVGAEEDGLAQGAGYVFRRDDWGTPDDLSDDRWYEEAKLVSSDRRVGDFLGDGVAIKGDLIVLGAPGKKQESFFGAGAAYVFRFVGGQWIQQQKVIASDPNYNQNLGTSAAIADGQFIVGALSDDSAAENAGSAYIFSMINDCNQNCIPDEDDLADQTSQDCDGNGVPDECEDCNNNGVGDACDLSAGTSADCNNNAVPDECDRDCNNNGLPDDCDLAAETSPDCNLNHVPDECDIASGFEIDCNADGIPDDCAAVCGLDCECHDRDVCTFDRCIAGVCTNTPAIYGDVDHDGDVDLFDLFSVLSAFGGDFSASSFLDADIEPCAGNGTINIFDLFAVLNAFAGDDPCCGG